MECDVIIYDIVAKLEEASFVVESLNIVSTLTHAS